tara:strand:- start:1740 stop:2177 length:438 start_codon:yes stop_codon:yes gene_type:complete
LDHNLKLKHTIDTLFGPGVSKCLPKNFEIKLSKKTGRIRSVYDKEKLLLTPRSDGGLAITIHCAKLFLKSKKFQENCLHIDKESNEFIKDGKSVFCGHVTSCGKNIKIGSDVPVLYKNQVIGVGKSVLSSKMIMSQNRGVAVKIR